MYTYTYTYVHMYVRIYAMHTYSEHQSILHVNWVPSPYLSHHSTVQCILGSSSTLQSHHSIHHLGYRDKLILHSTVQCILGSKCTFHIRHSILHLGYKDKLQGITVSCWQNWRKCRSPQWVMKEKVACENCHSVYLLPTSDIAVLSSPSTEAIALACIADPSHIRAWRIAYRAKWWETAQHRRVLQCVCVSRKGISKAVKTIRIYVLRTCSQLTTCLTYM